MMLKLQFKIADNPKGSIGSCHRPRGIYFPSRACRIFMTEHLDQMPSIGSMNSPLVTFMSVLESEAASIVDPWQFQFEVYMLFDAVCVRFSELLICNGHTEGCFEEHCTPIECCGSSRTRNDYGFFA